MSSSETQVKRVAVVVVHGIANQAPGDTLHAVSNSLLRLNDENGHVSYACNEETTVRIPVQNVKVSHPASIAAAAAPAAKRSVFEERSDYVLWLHRPKARPSMVAACKRAGVSQPHDYAHHFMREQLRDYHPQDGDRVYETQRLVSQRRDKQGRALEVHLYEMYWADLSRLPGGVLRFFGELYQLLFHLSSLGRHTIDFALAEHVDDASAKTWRVLSWFQKWANRLLTLPIPILNLLLLVATAVALVAELPERWMPVLALVLAGLVGGFAAVTFLYRNKTRSQIALLAVPVAAVAEAVWLASTLNSSNVITYPKIVAVCCAALVSATFSAAMKSYDQRRPGAARIAAWLGIPMLVAIFVLLILPAAKPDNHEHVKNMMRIIEIVFALLGVCWVALSVLSVGALAAGFVAIRATAKVSDPVAQSRARRAVATALMTLSIPSVAFLSITIALYWAFKRAIEVTFDKLGNFDYPILFDRVFGSNEKISAYRFADELIAVAASPAILLALFLIIVAAGCAVVGLLPAIWWDIRRSDTRIKILRNAVAAKQFAKSKDLGSWLDAGYQLLCAACVAIFIAFPFAYGASVLLWSVGLIKITPFSGSSADKPYLIFGTATLAAAGGLMAFHGQLQKLALGFRPALDAILDVDNYMREHPLDGNPRSRICARYASLLRYLCNWTDPHDGGKYSRLVIVSHSQGTVISAELLRFLAKEPDPALARLGGDLPVRLFTMGCPLRQLYGWRFPHLYRWARHDSDETGARPTSIPGDPLPDPKELKVRSWVNAYCSGDYVGRYLWRTDTSEIRWKPGAASIDALQLRKEFCIGAGAHNHYFDSTADAIRDELDRLIALNAK